MLCGLSCFALTRQLRFCKQTPGKSGRAYPESFLSLLAIATANNYHLERKDQTMCITILSRGMFHLVVSTILLVLCTIFASIALAVVPAPDGGYANGNTAEGTQ